MPIRACSSLFHWRACGTAYRDLWALEKLGGTFFLSGVDLFFVLSGFLVGGIILDRCDSTNFFKVFYIRRTCRIFPIYFLLIASFIIGLTAFKDQGFFKLWLLEKPLATWPYLVFMQSYFQGLANFSGPKWSAITWSVSVEEQFYMLMPFVIAFLGRQRGLIIVVAGIVIAPLIRMYLLGHVGFYAGYMFFPARMDTIFWGVLVAYVIRSERLRALAQTYFPWLVGVAVVSLGALAAEQLELCTLGLTARFSLIAAFYAIFIYALVEGRLKLAAQFLRSKFLVFTGAISYAMYMIHQLVNGLMHGFIYNDRPLIDGWERFAVTLISVAIVYWVCYLSLKYYEQPIRSWGAKFAYIKA